LDNKQHTEALALIAELLKELKRVDDKMALVEVQLLESRACHALRNLAKARASEFDLYICIDYSYLYIYIYIIGCG
jgi:hypothetical protein